MLAKVSGAPLVGDAMLAVKGFDKRLEYREKSEYIGFNGYNERSIFFPYKIAPADACRIADLATSRNEMSWQDA